MGTNPQREIPSSAYLSWPITYGLSFPEWVFCEIGSTRQYEIYANPKNWAGEEPQGVNPDFSECYAAPLAAFNTNPWKYDRKDRDHDEKDDHDENDHGHED
jgi:hypothetical protein